MASKKALLILLFLLVMGGISIGLPSVVADDTSSDQYSENCYWWNYYWDYYNNYWNYYWDNYWYYYWYNYWSYW